MGAGGIVNIEELTAPENWLLDDEVEHYQCENASHSTCPECHSGPGTHYAKLHCIGCGHSTIKVYCQPFVDYVKSNGLVHCQECRATTTAKELVTIIGPVWK
jgi:hypothetical protein